MKGGDVEKVEEGAEVGPLWGTNGNWGGKGGGPLEYEGKGSF